MRESEYEANIELARGIHRPRRAQAYKPAPTERSTPGDILTIAFGVVIGVLIAWGIIYGLSL